MSTLSGAVPPSPRQTSGSKPSARAGAEPSALARLEAERQFIWRLCYRMTGSSTDADDLVQETFVRAIERPPADVGSAWRPWLVRVAMNLCRDALRRRKRRRYAGFWLPSPVETGDPSSVEQAPASDESPEARYGLMESASFAFLVALEALTPSQRAVLLLRDAFDYSSEEAAVALDMTEGAVRITLHRARKAMADYDENRAPAKADRAGEIDAMLSRMLMCIARRDLDEARRIFTEDAVAMADGGGVYHAGRRRVVGPERILNLYNNLAARASPEARVEVRELNGAPAIVGLDPSPKKPNAPRWIILVDLAPDGRVRRFYSVIAPQKLAAVTWPLGARV